MGAATAMKTVPTTASVSAFIASVEEDGKRADCRELVGTMRAITGESPKMWGATIVGFGRYHYKYASGREGDYFITGFSPRKQNLTIYIMPGFSKCAPLLGKLGRHKTSKSCLYLRRLDDIDRAVPEDLVARSVREMRRRYPL